MRFFAMIDNVGFYDETAKKILKAKHKTLEAYVSSTIAPNGGTSVDPTTWWGSVEPINREEALGLEKVRERQVAMKYINE